MDWVKFISESNENKNRKNGLQCKKKDEGNEKKLSLLNIKTLNTLIVAIDDIRTDYNAKNEEQNERKLSLLNIKTLNTIIVVIDDIQMQKTNYNANKKGEKQGKTVSSQYENWVENE